MTFITTHYKRTLYKTAVYMSQEATLKEMVKTKHCVMLNHFFPPRWSISPNVSVASQIIRLNQYDFKKMFRHIKKNKKKKQETKRNNQHFIKILAPAPF